MGAERGAEKRECGYGAKRGGQRGVQGRVNAVMEHTEGSREGCGEEGMWLAGKGRGAERGAGKSKCGYGA